MDITDEIRDMVTSDANVDDIRNFARTQGMTTLREARSEADFRRHHDHRRNRTRNCAGRCDLSRTRVGTSRETTPDQPFAAFADPSSTEPDTRHSQATRGRTRRAVDDASGETTMPTFQYEAMDPKRASRSRKRSTQPAEAEAEAADPAEGLLRHPHRREERPGQEEGRHPRQRRKRQGRQADAPASGQEDAPSASARSGRSSSAPSRGSFRRCRTPACRSCEAFAFSKARRSPAASRTAC